MASMRLVALAAALVALVALLAPPLHAAAPPSPLPAGWTLAQQGPGGGQVWVGRIPDRAAPWDRRTSAIYLPPGYSSDHRYPVMYLLHGMRGSPSSIYSGMQLPAVADRLISTGQTAPFVAVMPVAGPVLNPDSGEWAGIWESFVVQDVVPWVDAHLSTQPDAAGRALAGLCAGGFGAVDIGLRHPGMFGTLESWEGYFAPVFRDGPFAGAGPAVLAAHDPTLLVRQNAAALRRGGVRFYVSVGGNHGRVLRRWTLGFAGELAGLRLPHELWQLPAADRGHFWRATLPSALAYAAAAFRLA